MNSSELAWVFLIGLATGAALLALGQLIYRRVHLLLEQEQVSGALDKGETPKSWVDFMNEFEQSEAWVEAELKTREHLN